MKKIKLSQGKYALVDDNVYEQLKGYNWFADKHNSTYYAVRNNWHEGDYSKVYMHRQILSSVKGSCVDHLNHEGLDNRKINLRTCSNANNVRYQRPRVGCSSQYKGVCWDKRSGKWCAYISPNRKRISLGYFSDEIEAAKAYDAAAIKYFGEYSYINFGKRMTG